MAPDACRTDCRRAYCGDGVLDGDEACDLDALGNRTCETEGFSGGQLGCAEDCRLDTSGCTQCGDGVAAGQESCDGSDLQGQDCASLSAGQHGTLRCDQSCAFDTSGCYTCGDGVVSRFEQCEGDDLQGQTCESEGYTLGELACDPSTCLLDRSGCVSVCGNGAIEAGEDCDGGALGGLGCSDVGNFAGGELRCDAECLFDTRDCETCGNHTLDPGEACDDGNQVSGDGCNATCTSDETCPNAFLDPGEACDATSFSQSPDCTAHGYHGGWMTCRNDCTVDDSDCLAHGRCGDGALQPTYEICDGAALDGQSCLSLGYYGGTLACEAGCGAFALTDCASHGRCGDGDIQSGYGEACDGQNLGGQTCQSLGLGIHGLSCSANCVSAVEWNLTTIFTLLPWPAVWPKPLRRSGSGPQPGGPSRRTRWPHGSWCARLRRARPRPRGGRMDQREPAR